MSCVDVSRAKALIAKKIYKEIKSAFKKIC